MTDVRVAVRSLLINDPTISLLIDDRVFFLRAPQTERNDYVVYNRVSSLTDYVMTGPSGLVRVRFQIDCWSTVSANASRIADLVKDKLSGFKGEVLWGESSPEEAVKINGIFADTLERDSYDPELDMYAMGRDYLVWYQE